MEKITYEQLRELESNFIDQLRDGRFACINGKFYEHQEIDSISVVSVFDSPDVYTAVNDNNLVYEADDFVEAFTFTDHAKAERYFIERLSEAVLC